MIDLIQEHGAELERLCRKHHVKTLEVFGSAAAGTFDPARSDLDFLVDYLPLEDGQHAPAYFGLLHDLEDLFHRKIDLVMDRAIRNRYFRQGVNQSRRMIYAS
jgi:predicted nucleotidyltransferase